MKTEKIISVLLIAALLISAAGVSVLALSGNVSADVVEKSKKAAVDAEAEGIRLWAERARERSPLTTP